MMHYLHYPYSYFMLGNSQVFPIKVVVLNAIVHKELRRVAKTNFRYDSVTTIWMLTGLLQIENSLNSLIFELLNDVMLLDEPITESLRPDQQIFHPF